VPLVSRGRGARTTTGGTESRRASRPFRCARRGTFVYDGVAHGTFRDHSAATTENSLNSSPTAVPRVRPFPPPYIYISSPFDRSRFSVYSRAVLRNVRIPKSDATNNHRVDAPTTAVESIYIRDLSRGVSEIRDAVIAELVPFGSFLSTRKTLALLYIYIYI